jgi:hypothetical protein
MAHARLLLGRVAHAQGDRDTASALLQQSLCRCQESNQPGAVAERLEALAAVEREQERLIRAARLLGAAAALRDIHGPSVPPIDRADHEHQVAALRAAMGAEAFAAARAAGRAMSLHGPGVVAARGRSVRAGRRRFIG